MKESLFPHLEKARNMQAISDITAYAVVAISPLILLSYFIFSYNLILVFGFMLIIVLFVISVIYSIYAKKTAKPKTEYRVGNNKIKV